MSRKSRLFIVVTSGLLALTSAALAQRAGDAFGPSRLWERAEISLTLGYGRSLADWTSLHLREFSSSLYPRVSAQNRIQMSAKGALFAGGAASFFFRSGLALQGGFGYLKAGVTADTRFEFGHTRAPGFSASEAFEGTGEITTIPVFVNIVNRFDIVRGSAGRNVKGYVYVGPALFFNSLVIDAFAGAAAVVQAVGPGGLLDERADAFKVPVAIEDKTWVAVGGNIGLGLDLQVAKPLALTVEGRFFYAPKKNLFWKWEPGVVNGLYGNIAQTDFTANLAAANMEATTSLTIKPSCFQFSTGIKIVF